MHHKLIAQNDSFSIGPVITAKKRNDRELTGAEIKGLVRDYVAGIVPDYQMTAFLMAVWFNGMSNREATDLTLAMRDSGKSLDLSSIPGFKVDKHSTGGVGDGTSFPLIALMGCFGLVVPMMSGRGLGHTGGTLDKLESIPGLTTRLAEDRVLAQLRDIGLALFSQTDDIVPADKKMYALRDVTQTVDSIPLIAASIMSKKLAEGTDALVLNVTTGSGAFMRELEDARKLARLMVAIAKGAGKKATAVISSMDQPLGRYVGNALEIMQTIRILRGETTGFEDFLEVVYALGTQMLILAGVLEEKNAHLGPTVLREKILRGEALDQFAQLIESQGGNHLVVDKLERLPQAEQTIKIPSPAEGYVQAIDTEKVGWAACYLGAGRERLDSTIDPAVGIQILKKVGSPVNRGEPLARFFANPASKVGLAQRVLLEAYQIGAVRPALTPRVIEIVR